MARRVVALASILPWWLPMRAHAAGRPFDKELLTVLFVGFAGVIATWSARRRSDLVPASPPRMLAALATGLALALQAVD